MATRSWGEGSFGWSGNRLDRKRGKKVSQDHRNKLKPYDSSYRNPTTKGKSARNRAWPKSLRQNGVHA